MWPAWRCGRRADRLEPFDDYNDALTAAEVPPPFPGAFESSTYTMGADEVRALLTSAGFTSVDVSVVEHTIVWPNAAAAISAIFGTPFGPLIAGLPADRREALDRELARRLPATAGEPVRRTAAAVIARAAA